MEEELEKFLIEYKAKLERERLELFTLSARIRAKQSPEAVAEVPEETSAANGIPVRGERNQPSASLQFESGSGVTHDDDDDERMERRRKQREYRTCLDEQVAEKRHIKEQEECSCSYQDAPAQDWPVRSASPPIRSHYRHRKPTSPRCHR